MNVINLNNRLEGLYFYDELPYRVSSKSGILPVKWDWP